MSPERWQRVKEVLDACLDHAPAERTEFLTRACGEDADLRREVESLAASYEQSDDVLERPLHPADDPGALVGRTAGEYRFVREIGEGGMSRVYLAERTGPGEPRQAAIKLVKRGMDYEFVLRRFRQESHIMAALEHPNIARMLGGGSTEDGIPYFVMEYIAGQPIDQYCDSNRLGVCERLHLFRTVCLAVQFAHEHGVVHRDIKPGNILIADEGVPKLLDFGIAKVVDPQHWTHSFDQTASVLRLMTPEYASPEQVRGEYVLEPSDIYSLGVLLYELLTGHRPYRLRSHSAPELARAICEDAPPRPSSVVAHRAEVSGLPGGPPAVITPEEVGGKRQTDPRRLRRLLSGDLDNIVLMALRKEPRRRYASVRELSEDIRLYLEGRPVTARRDTLAYRSTKFLGRNRRAAIGGAAAAAVVAVLGAGAWWLGRDSSAGFEPAPPRVRPFTTMPGNERQPVFSPDGRSVAFVWDGDDGSRPDIYVRPLEGGGMQRLTSGPAADLSPAWSPDGRRIAFLGAGKDRTAVFIATLPSGAPATIAEVYANRIEAVGRHLDWSPDGRFLAVADKAEAAAPFSIYLVHVSDGAKTKLTAPTPRTIGDSSPAFSPDGQWISFLRAPSSGITEVWIQPVAGGEARRLTEDNRTVEAQTWAPGGKAVVFSSNRTGGLTLWSVPVRGGKPRRVPGVGAGASEPAFSRDGRQMVYTQSFLDANVWRVALEGDGTVSPPRKLIASTVYDSSAQYSPDGSRIAFRSDRSGFHEIWVCDAEGRNAVQLTHFNGPLTGTPRWSPDGKWIAFDSRPEGQADIYAVGVAGGPPRPMTNDGSEDVVPSWSRDGQWIYFASNRSGSWQVWKVPFGGGPKVQVTRQGGFAAFESSDRQWVYYALSRSQPGLYRVPLDGGREEPVLDRLKPGYWGYWALGRGGIYFLDAPQATAVPSLYFYGFAGGDVLRLAAIDRNIPLGDSGMALSPDGRSLLYTQVDQSGSDVMLADFGPR